MNNEIKEILDDFKWYIEQKNEQDINGEYEYPRELTQEEAKILLDYITNLQEEKDSLDDYNRHLHNELKDYKSRIDKAIDFIEEELTFYITIGGTDERKLIGYNKAFDKLLKILQGSEKE